MHLLIIASQLRNKPSGMGMHAFEFLKNLSQLLEKSEFGNLKVTAIVPDDVTVFFKGIEYVRLPIGKTRKVYNRAYWYFIGIRKIVKDLNPEAVLSLDGKTYNVCCHSFFSIIHDSCVFSEDSKAFFGKLRTVYWRKEFARSIEISRKVFVPTVFVKKSLLSIFPEFCKKVVPVFDVAPDNFSTFQNGKKRHFLYIGQITYRKNIHNVIRAYVFDKDNSLPPLLLIGERWDSKYRELRDAIKELNQSPAKDKIKFLGYVSEEEKYELIKASFALILLSFCEGFGIPVIEAAKFGVPAIVPKESPMREILKDCCYTVSNIENPYEIYLTLKSVIQNPSFVNKDLLRDLGNKNWSSLHVLTVMEHILNYLKSPQ